jgi:hypothetical protein
MKLVAASIIGNNLFPQFFFPPCSAAFGTLFFLSAAMAIAVTVNL